MAEKKEFYFMSFARVVEGSPFRESSLSYCHQITTVHPLLWAEAETKKGVAKHVVLYYHKLSKAEQILLVEGAKSNE